MAAKSPTGIENSESRLIFCIYTGRKSRPVWRLCYWQALFFVLTIVFGYLAAEGD